MSTSRPEELEAYAVRLRRYTRDELEDVYFNIHILRDPSRYRVLLNELQRRSIRIAEPAPLPHVEDIGLGMCRARFLRRLPVLHQPLIALLVLGGTTAYTFLLLAPIWLFAVPLRFLGAQTAIAYLAYAPIALALGADFGWRLGGRRRRWIPTVVGLALAVALFYATGAPAVVARSVVESGGGSGMSFGF